jgi:ABC-type transport system involved in multi-copper enzyme maturation permease subunit
MTFLPIAARELRVAARKPNTFWVRFSAALTGLTIGAAFLLLIAVASRSHVGGVPTATLGGALFGTLTWLALAAALSTGLFLTSDCLSEEKREGTMGFLFLTDLRGYDIILGKLLASSLRGFFALLAVLPVFAVPLLMGGVTGLQFWKTSLALVNALIFSLAAGMLVSVLSRDSQKALAGSILLLLVLVFAGPLLDLELENLTRIARGPWWSLASPGFVFVRANDWGRSPFWTALLVNQGVVLLMFALCIFLVPRTWRQRSGKRGFARNDWAYAWKFGGANRRKKQRTKFLAGDPVLWLACREQWQAFGVWLLAFLFCGFEIYLAATHQSGANWLGYRYLSFLFLFLLYLWTASQSARFFIDARKSGLIELLLVTPITEQQIVRGQWRALCRVFGLPLILILAAEVIAALASDTTNLFGGAGTTGTPGPGRILHWVSAAGTAINLMGNLLALAWFGMWMGMTSKNNHLATLKTILFVQVIPWFAITYSSAIAIPLFLFPTMLKGGLSANSPPSPRMAQMGAWIPLIFSAVSILLTLAKNICFVIWSRRKLRSSFRGRALRFTSPIVPARVTSPPAVQIPAPPVIAQKL